MKRKIVVFSVVLFFLVVIMLVSCGKQKAEWKGTIEEENGVTVVKNPNEPLYGELVFDLEEDLSIGREDDENYLFYRVWEIKVDENENIFVFDRGNMRIQKYDRDGNYLCSIGRKGEGPGEFMMPSIVIIDDKNGIICVQDRRKLIVFDKDGNYLEKDTSLGSYFYDLLVDSRGTIWGISTKQEGDDVVTADIFKVFAKLDNEGKVKEEYAIFPFDYYRERMGNGILSISTGEEYDLFVSPVRDKNMVYGYSKEYELYVVDLEGNLHTKIKKDELYQNFTAEERGKSRKAKLPEHKPFFYYLFTDSEGRIYVQKNNVRRFETEEKKFDIFSQDGYFLYRVVCPLFPFEIRDGFFYTLVSNEDTGEVFVKRYNIKNWKQIKKEK